PSRRACDVVRHARTAPLDLRRHGPQRLVSAARRRGGELVEQREIRRPPPRERRVAFELEAPREPAYRAGRFTQTGVGHPEARKIASRASEAGSTATQLTRGATTPARPTPSSQSDWP